MTDLDQICGRPTKRGTACTMNLHSWLDSHLRVHHADGCWQHMSGPYRQAQQERKERAAADYARWERTYNPACWSWPVPENLDSWEPTPETAAGEHGHDLPQEVIDDLLAVDRTPRGRAAALLSHWQNKRCAFCGRSDAPVVEDHDHHSGLVRGLLCRSCNTREGMNRGEDGPFGRYRSWPPTAILGLEIRYFDPFTGEYAPDRRDEPPVDPWQNAISLL